MEKRRKNKSNPPRHKRMNRTSRLQAATHWIPRYEGKNLVSSYSKHFAVDKLCAATELEMLGYPVKSSYKKQLKDTVTQKQRESERRNKLKRQKQLRKEQGLWEDNDETFSFMVGYTPGGAPYGLTWEEWYEIERANRQDPEINSNGQENNDGKSDSLYINNDELPF